MIMSYLMPACERMSHFWNIQTLKSYEVNILELDGPPAPVEDTQCLESPAKCQALAEGS